MATTAGEWVDDGKGQWVWKGNSSFFDGTAKPDRAQPVYPPPSAGPRGTGSPTISPLPTTAAPKTAPIPSPFGATALSNASVTTRPSASTLASSPFAATTLGTGSAAAKPAAFFGQAPPSTPPTTAPKPPSVSSTLAAGFPAAGAVQTATGTAKPLNTNPLMASMGTMAFGAPGGAPKAPLQSPGNNMTNPGYTEQGLEHVQNRLLEDPYGQQTQNQYQQTQTPSAGESYLNQNLGTLDGPGQGSQYWNQQQGQFNSPFAGEQFTREATQNMSPTGAAGSFFDQSMQQYDQFTGYQGPQNTQGQYGQSSQQLANGTQGEQGLGQIAGQYDQIGQYNGPNQAQGQYQQNAGSGPLAGQQFYDQVAGQAGTTGRYSDPNLAAGQYSQTQQAFDDLPIANFDPFYDRASQLATQNYNRDAAGRGVYGSSEALSGVGNIITDIEAQRANRSFDAEMQRAQEQRARQGLLGEQARMGDLSSLAGFGANLAGLETFGNLANAAGNQTLGQQTMLGNQARQADVSATDAFNQNLQGAQTFGNLNEAQGRLELDRNQLLGNMANNADSQALGAQQANISGLNAFGDLAGQADSAETNRFNARTGAMRDADRTTLDRLGLGADVAFRADDSERADFTAGANAAAQSGDLELGRERLGADIANMGSDNDLNRLDSFMGAANTAEDDRQSRQNSAINAAAQYSGALQSAIQDGTLNALRGDQQGFEDYFAAEIAPELQAAGLSQQQQDQIRQDIGLGLDIYNTVSGGDDDED